jgi:hypothetical protein
MIQRCFIQKHKGEFFSEAAYCFWQGCQYLGYDTLFFEQEQGIDGLDLNRSTDMVYGGIGLVRKAFDKLGVKQPAIDGMPPESIREFYGRRVWATTMLEVREGYETGLHFFIKPLHAQKQFTGLVTSGRLSDLSKTAWLPDDFPIMASEVVSFESEYRLFVHERKIIGCKNYRGDFRKWIDFKVAEQVVAAYTDAPVAHSLDLGVTDEGRTLVVEINDAFSLGAYGLSSVPYTRMVIDRWEEIVSIPTAMKGV